MNRSILEPDLDYLQRVLLEMLAIPSPTGFTDTIVRYVAERLEELGIPFELTRRGTLRATLKGQISSPDRAVSAHLDTIGPSGSRNSHSSSANTQTSTSCPAKKASVLMTAWYGT